MSDVPIVTRLDAFPDIPSSTRLVIAIPTARWTPMARSVLASMVGIANEETTVLIADNSENPEKREFLKKLRAINPHIVSVCHEKNIGAKDNTFYLYDWTRNVEFFSIMADDDWMSPTYHTDAYQTLLANPKATCAETGTTFVDFGDRRLIDVSQPTMSGPTMLDRLAHWQSFAARVTMYNVSRRSALETALEYIRKAPFLGVTLGECLWELNRLALGDFVHAPGHGCFVHYPEHASLDGNRMERYYNLLCKDVGLSYQMTNFMSLSTAIQCAMFLMGKLSPIADPVQREACGQQVYGHILRTGFLPFLKHNLEEINNIFHDNIKVLNSIRRFSSETYVSSPILDEEAFDCFLNIVKSFESPEKSKASSSSIGDET